MTGQQTLPDLTAVIANCKTEIQAIDPRSEVKISPSNASALIDAYRTLNSSHTIELVGGHTFIIGTGDQTRHISVQEMPVLSILADNLRALEAFRVSLDQIAHDMGFSSRTGDGNKFFGEMPNEAWQSKVSSQELTRFNSSLVKLFPNPQDQEKIVKFVTDPNWSGMKKEDGTIGRKLNRSTDWQESAILKTGGLVAAASAGRINLIRAIEHAGFGAGLVEKISTTSPPIAYFQPGENVIFYGAPGTGKSNSVNRIVDQAGKKPFRTVFHPDLQNSDFFGSLKPRMVGGDVHYEFAPGPFMSALAEAYTTPTEPVYLVIEELNRAAAAAVFGDLFLLLDRHDSGWSEYDVDFPSPESKAWFQQRTQTPHENLLIPSNLFIYATMNSADQGVYPIDTAFRRRWRQEYLPLDYSKGPTGTIAYIDSTGTNHSIAWRDFIRLLNNHLLNSQTLDISEDRLIGQWFVKENELDGKTIPQKVLLYLWDDLLRHEGRDHIFNSGRNGDVKTFGELVELATEGKRFFSHSFLDKLGSALKSPDEAKADSSEDAS